MQCLRTQEAIYQRSRSTHWWIWLRRGTRAICQGVPRGQSSCGPDAYGSFRRQTQAGPSHCRPAPPPMRDTKASGTGMNPSQFKQQSIIFSTKSIIFSMKSMDIAEILDFVAICSSGGRRLLAQRRTPSLSSCLVCHRQVARYRHGSEAAQKRIRILPWQRRGLAFMLCKARRRRDRSS